MWPFNHKTKEKFAPKNINKKAYVDGLHQIENTPEIAALEGEKVVVRKVEQTVAEMQGTVENSTEIAAVEKNLARPLFMEGMEQMKQAFAKDGSKGESPVNSMDQEEADMVKVGRRESKEAADEFLGSSKV